MIVRHSPLSLPENISQTTWRYFDFTKYVDLLQTRELYFPRADLLGDPFEGSISQSSVEHRKQRFNELIDRGELSPNYRDAVDEHEKGRKALRNMFISCWHMNDYESAAMWKLYLKSDEGVAIRSRVELLRNALERDPLEIALGQVRYVDYNQDHVPWGNVLTPFIHKRRSFEHEREFRAIIWRHDGYEGEGIRIKIIPENVIEAVHVCPNSPLWFRELVESVTKRLGFDVPVVQSSLNDTSVFY
jgi:hypothetical protein